MLSERPESYAGFVLVVDEGLVVGSVEHESVYARGQRLVSERLQVVRRGPHRSIGSGGEGFRSSDRLAVDMRGGGRLEEI